MEPGRAAAVGEVKIVGGRLPEHHFGLAAIAADRFRERESGPAGGDAAQPGQCRSKSRQCLGEPTLVPSDDAEYLGVSLPPVRVVDDQLQEFGALCFGELQISTHNCQAPSGQQGHPLQEWLADVHGDLRGRIECVLESIRSSLLQEGRGQEPDCLVPGHRVVRPVGEVDGSRNRRARRADVCGTHVATAGRMMASDEKTPESPLRRATATASSANSILRR